MAGMLQISPVVTVFDSQPCYLLTLPPELRNRIFEQVCNVNDETAVSVTGYECPGLLRTCKQIRSETLAVFYAGRTFSFDIGNFDPETASRFSKTLPRVLKTNEWFNWQLDYASVTPHWENLLQWLQLYHVDLLGMPAVLEPSEVRRLSGPGDVSIVWVDTIGCMFVVAKNMRGQEWDVVKMALEEMRHILVILDPRWA